MPTPAPSRPLLTAPPGPTQTEAAHEAWQQICTHLQGSLASQAYHTWFSPLNPVDFSGGVLTVQVPSRFYYEWIEGHYAPLIDQALRETLGDGASLSYVSGNGTEEDDQPPAPITVKQTTRPDPKPRKDPFEHGLNARYRFDNFIEGPQNRFPRAAAIAVAAAPGKTNFNPLLVYGGVGLGKTHLLQAIGNAALAHDYTITVRYISVERFTQDFVEAIKSNRADRFSALYQQVDVLLMDDVQFFSGRERTQMEFFHIFNALYQSGKQIVLTSDKPPRELHGLDERLVSRFGSGLVYDINPPDFDTRVAIITRISEEEAVELGEDVVHYLARHFTKNVREMQGALIRLLAHASLTGSEITVETARSALEDLLQKQHRPVSIDSVQRVVGRHYEIPPDLLMAKIRTKPIARARMIAMALCLRLTGHSLKQVGARFGRRDHTTVLHARKKIQEWLESDPSFVSEFETLIKLIENDSDPESP